MLDFVFSSAFNIPGYIFVDVLYLFKKLTGGVCVTWLIHSSMIGIAFLLCLLCFYYVWGNMYNNQTLYLCISQAFPLSSTFDSVVFAVYCMR